MQEIKKCFKLHNGSMDCEEWIINRGIVNTIRCRIEQLTECALIFAETMKALAEM